jgi:two-component system sensor histidine kinase KdpD
MQRPNPDDLLAQVKAEEAQSNRGLLKIFFGYAAGVGKTYSMLSNARDLHAGGKDIVVGYVEPHRRPETEALLDGLEAIPVKQVSYRGVTLREFDVDAALARRPELILVDELAHSNAEGCRHGKRWQDVEELLAAGINVWTTLNVQHIESLSDVVGQITGVVVQETVPDQVFEKADDLELVDITPEELVARLRAGKVYVPEQAAKAMLKFFQKAHLTALRELSLRQAARRIHVDVESARTQKTHTHPWATNDKLLVCVGPSPTTGRVIRTAKRMATALDAPWLAVSVDPAGASNNPETSQQLAQHFRLAERLGAESITLSGENAAETILEFARSRNVTKILVGKTARPRWKRLLFGTIVDELLEKSGDIDVYAIHGVEEEVSSAPRVQQKAGVEWWPLLASTGIVAFAGLVASASRNLHLADAEANTVMLFLAGVAYVAYRYGRWPATWASVLSVMLFDLFFVPPAHTFKVADVRYVVTFAVMLAIGLAISALTSRLKAMVVSSRVREQRTLAQYELGKQLASLYGNAFLVTAAGEKIADMIDGEVAIFLARPNREPELAFGHEGPIASHSASQSAAQWVIRHHEIAGSGTNTLPNAPALFLPLTASQKTMGAIAIKVEKMERLLQPDTRRLLESCSHQLGLALERDQLAVEAAEARLQAETEHLRSSLLSGVSHDLKTPLAAIAGASSSLLESQSIDEAIKRQLLETVAEEADRLNRLLDNIMQMSKLDAGASQPNKQWHVIEEIVGSALRRVDRQLAGHTVTLDIPVDLPLIWVDGLLMEQLLVNLLENASRYTPEGASILVTARAENDRLRLVVADNGPGLPAGDEEKIFEKFYRVSPLADGGRGSGLGLAICRAIARVHGGDVTASNRPTGGAEFVVRLPLAKHAPQVVVE